MSDAGDSRFRVPGGLGGGHLAWMGSRDQRKLGKWAKLLELGLKVRLGFSG